MANFEIHTSDGTVAAQVRARIVEVLVDGFSQDIALLDMTGDDPSLSPLIYRSWVDATLHSGKIDTVIVDGIIQGVALWFGPGEEMLGTPEQAKLGWEAVFNMFSPYLARWWKEDYPPQIAACERLCGNVHKSGWYLALLAVHSSQQRKGLGAALLRYGIDRAARDEVPVVLECEPENTEFYGRFGLKVMGTLPIKGPTKSWRSCALRKDSATGQNPT